MKKALALLLGLLTAIGGFVDIGDIVTAGVVGSRFGLSLAWVLVVGTFSICVFAEMSGRVAAVSGRPTFDLIRERLGPRVGLLNLVGSIAVTLLTFIAEIGGVALALQLATSVNPYLWIPVVAAALWLVFWRVKFSALEDTFGLGGLALVVFAVAVWQLSPDWSQMWHEASTATMPQPEGIPTYWYYAVAIFGATMTPYEVFFFSSGGVEEGWTRKDIPTMRANVFLGFPLGAVLSVAITASAAIVFLPLSIEVGELSQTVLPVGMALGKIGIAIALLGLFAATFGAACETGLSVGYSVCQYFGWQWGKYAEPLHATRFHTILLLLCILGPGVLLTTVDPIMVTEYSVVFSAVALPLTYIPILIVANDRTYMGDRVNGWLANVCGTAVLVPVLVASAAAVPLMLITRVGQ
ncbi:divalent metal cation transporter [Janibacter terrae]|uniref:Divalent metal cation transporter n=1 Tax=Janibacter terrae TaxID=103817 RepID=A0ABZ2FGI4_9MICO|nr:divalent metal cation transporter [Janibacter terrae]HBO53923.1 hypothetical protein [Janibacter terrae]